MVRFLPFLFLLFTSLFAKESYTIARDATWTPYDLGNETYPVTGFTASLLREISKEEGVLLDLQETNFSILFEGLCSGKYDGVFTTLAPDQANQQRFNFSAPLLNLGPVLIVREDSDAKRLSDLKGSSLGINAFDRTILMAQKESNLHIQLYQSMPLALQDLAAGKIEGVLMGTIQAHALVPHLYTGVLRIATSPLNEDGVRLVTLKGKEKKLISLFNHGIKKLKKSGKYRRMRLEFGVY